MKKLLFACFVLSIFLTGCTQNQQQQQLNDTQNQSQTQSQTQTQTQTQTEPDYRVKNSDKFTIEGNQTNSEDIKIKDTDLEIGNSARQEGDIYVDYGDVKIGGNAVITGSIYIDVGSLEIGNSTTVEGEIFMSHGHFDIGGNSQFRDTIEVENGNFEAGNSNSFKDIIVGNGSLELGGNNTVNGDLISEQGRIKIGNSNNITGKITGRQFEQGGNNVLENEFEEIEQGVREIGIEGLEYYGKLVDVTGGNASGSVQAEYFEDGNYTVMANFKDLPELEDGYFYEGWIVRESPLSIVSTGEANFGPNVLVNNVFNSDKDYTDHTLFVLTLEPDDGDPAPAEHILEGELTKFVAS